MKIKESNYINFQSAGRLSFRLSERAAWQSKRRVQPGPGREARAEGH